jgi:hypothetical protein
VDGIASGAPSAWGPLFVKEIPGFVKVQDIYCLTAQIQFTDVSGRMGYLTVALFDENKELVSTLCAYDSWTGTTNKRYLAYYKADSEGGAYDSWLEQSLTTSWTAKFEFYCDSATKAATSKVDDGTPQTHTHFTAQNYNKDRVVRYIGIQFARNTVYTYDGVYLKLDYLKLVYNKLCKEFNDPCDNTVGWTQDLEWPGTFFDTASGTLTSTSGYLQVSGLGVMNKGPFWYKELSETFPVNQFTELVVQLQGAGPTNSLSAFDLALYDEDKIMAARFSFEDPYQGEAGCLSVLWHQELGYTGYPAWLDLGGQQTWDMTLRLYRNTDNEFVAEIPGTSPKTIMDFDDWAMESSRIIRYIGIQWAYYGTPINNIRLKDVMLRSGYAYTYADSSSAGSCVAISTTIDPDSQPPPPPESLKPSFFWNLLYGFWPEFHAVVEVGDPQDGAYLKTESITDIAYNSRIICTYKTGLGALPPQQVAQRLSVIEERQKDLQDLVAGFRLVYDVLWCVITGLQVLALFVPISTLQFFVVACIYAAALIAYAVATLHAIMHVVGTDLAAADKAALFYNEVIKYFARTGSFGLCVASILWGAYYLGYAEETLFGSALNTWIRQTVDALLLVLLLWWWLNLAWGNTW